jgi:Protein of unknown function (DUF2934)
MMKPTAHLPEDRIRVRAYHLWEASGRPPGREQEFWARAHELIATEDHPPTETVVRSTKPRRKSPAKSAISRSGASR